MHSLKTTLGTFLLLFVCGHLSAQKINADIAKASADWHASFESGSVAEVMSIYTDEAVLMPPNMPAIEGMDAIKEFWTGMLSSGVVAKHTTESAEAYGKTGIETGVVELYIEGQMVDKVKFIIVWKKEGKSWKISRDIWNSNNGA